MRDLRLGLSNLRPQNLQLRFGHVLLVQRQLVVLLRIIQRGHRYDSLFRHALRTIIGAFQHGNVWALGIYFGPFHVGFGPAQAGVGGFGLRFGLCHMGLNLFFVELGQDLAPLHPIPGIHVKLLHDATGLRLDFDLGDGLDLAGRDHALS